MIGLVMWRVSDELLGMVWAVVNHFLRTKFHGSSHHLSLVERCERMLLTLEPVKSLRGYERGDYA